MSRQTSSTKIKVEKADTGCSTNDLGTQVAQYLAPIVIDLEALVVNGKQAHWHVRGRNFIGVHEFMDRLVEHVQEYADTAAERIVALGQPVDARVATVAAQTTLPPLSEGFQDSDVTIRELVAQIDAALAHVHCAVDGLSEIDPSSQDIVIEIERGLMKDRWFLDAHLAESS